MILWVNQEENKMARTADTKNTPPLPEIFAQLSLASDIVTMLYVAQGLQPVNGNTAPFFNGSRADANHSVTHEPKIG